jgi:hypothetical protein
LVAWDKVQRPLVLGGLGIPDIKLMGHAIQLRWLLASADGSQQTTGVDAGL